MGVLIGKQVNALTALRSVLSPPKMPPCSVPHVELKSVPRILVADDDPDYCQLLTRWLQGDGMEVEVARSVDEAKDKTNSDKFDIVVLDLKFGPDVEGGLEYLHWANRYHPMLTIIVCSGEPSYIANALNELVSMDAITLMYKPLRPEQLLRVINRFLSYGLVAE
jgi:DNA-binding NtrC family response regulator